MWVLYLPWDNLPNCPTAYARISRKKREGTRSFRFYMLKAKVVTLLKIRPEETRMVTLMAVLFLVVQAGQGFGDTAAFALFVSQNVDRLPYMYVPLGLIVFLVSMGYTASLGRFQNANVVLWFLAGFAVLLLGEWIAIVLFKI